MWIQCVLHHAGKINYTSLHIEYIDGEMFDMGFRNVDEMSIECVRKEVLGLGYSEDIKLYYKLSTKSFQMGLTHLEVDNDYISLTKAVQDSKELSVVLEFYVIHGTNQPYSVKSDDSALVKNSVDVDSDDGYESDDTWEFDEGSETERVDDVFMETVNNRVDQVEIEVWMGQQHGFGGRERCRNVDNRDADSDSLESEQLDSPNESSDTDNEHVAPKYNPSTDKGKTVVIEVGKAYPDQIVFRWQLKQYALANGFDYKITKNDKRRVTAVCKHDDLCKWRIYASWNTEETSFVVKTFEPKHECGQQYYNSKVTGRWIAETFFDNIKESSNIENVALQALVKRKYNVFATLQQCYRAKRLVINKVYGDELKQYERLGAYIEAIKMFNPGSRALVKTDGSGHFLRIYICLDACRKGFLNGCRPFIGLDACHLKVYQQGQFFSAVSCDANDNLFPIAWAICEIENTETWRWFIGELITDIGLDKAKICTFMSDMQKGLDRALREEIEGVDHRFCVRHMYNNYKKSFKGDIFKNMMWEAATATTDTKFKIKMAALNEVCSDAYDWLCKIPVKQWSRHAFNEKTRCAMLLNNLCESFNAMIRDARDKPIIVMLEMIRRRLMERFNAKYQGMLEYDKFVCPRILKLVERIRKYEKEYRTILCDDGEFEVEHVHDGVNVVTLSTMTCTCKKWQLMGIPCTHACAAIVANKQKPEEFVYNCFTKATFLSIYEGRIHGIPSWEHWPASTIRQIQPPIRKKQPGRPKKRRNREDGERQDPTKYKRSNTSLKCSRCQDWRHNIRTCKGEAKPKKKYRRAGDNIKVIDLSDGTRQAIRRNNLDIGEQQSSVAKHMSVERLLPTRKDKGKEPVEIEATLSQPKPSQDNLENPQGIRYTPSHEGPAVMPMPGVVWQGTPQPDPIIQRSYVFSREQIRQVAAKFTSKKKN